MSNIDPTRMRAWRLFLETHAEIVDVLAHEMEDEVGLPLTWYEVLLRLQEAPDRRMRMHELAESLLVSRSATTRFIDRMEGAGLVQRRSCDSDRRGTFVALTDEGRRVLAQAAPIHLRGIQEHFSGHLSQREAVELNRLLEKLLSAQRVRTHH